MAKDEPKPLDQTRKDLIAGIIRVTTPKKPYKKKPTIWAEDVDED
ncbi:hypothetical protein OIE13_05850 [Streptosporangium sp. NBC_01810]|nr:hypothetical protein [Streptosporangium sp. NBC_01810]WSA27396.1 hypothetical protein OIE13_05850 [Streptosporangium sp. NBC_01810]